MRGTVRLILLLSVFLIASTVAAQEGYIDAWAYTSVADSTANVRSSLTMMYISTDACHDANCVLAMTGTHWIKAESGATVREKAFTVPNTYRATISTSGTWNQCYYTEGRGVHQWLNPPLGATQPKVIAEATTISNEACVPPVSTACLPGQMNCDSSPIIISFRGDYHLTSAVDGVWFDIDADGVPEHVSWTAAGEALAFLAFDRNGNGRIDDGSELFGDHTQLANGDTAANGWEAVAELDLNGDAMVGDDDPSWTDLLLWFDTNHDGNSDETELVSLVTSPVRGIGGDYRWIGRRDPFGNMFRFQGHVVMNHGRRACYDVYLVTSQ